ncbi:hypothetical protein [Alloalcanivorax xenomutans]
MIPSPTVIQQLIDRKVRPLGADPAVRERAQQMAIVMITHGGRRLTAIRAAVSYAAKETDQ